VADESEIIETLQDMNSRLRTILGELNAKRKGKNQLESQDIATLNNIYNELIQTTNTIKRYLNKDTKQTTLFE
jgi:hypothetical protein